MNYRIIPVTSFSQNCSLIWCEQTKLGSLIDPGGNPEKIKKEITEIGITLVSVLLTHGHLDHVGAAASLAQHYGVPIVGPGKEDEYLLKALPIQSFILGMDWCKPMTPLHWLKEGDTLSIGNVNLQVLHCPGHTPGHIVFFNEWKPLLFSGDTLFKGGIGFSDFPYSNRSQLLRSIKQKLLPLGDDVAFVSGHGPMSILGYEKKNNPFLKKTT